MCCGDAAQHSQRPPRPCHPAAALHHSCGSSMRAELAAGGLDQLEADQDPLPDDQPLTREALRVRGAAAGQLPWGRPAVPPHHTT